HVRLQVPELSQGLAPGACGQRAGDPSLPGLRLCRGRATARARLEQRGVRRPGAHGYPPGGMAGNRGRMPPVRKSGPVSGRDGFPARMMESAIPHLLGPVRGLLMPSDSTPGKTPPPDETPAPPTPTPGTGADVDLLIAPGSRPLPDYELL